MMMFIELVLLKNVSEFPSRYLTGDQKVVGSSSVRELRNFSEQK